MGPVGDSPRIYAKVCQFTSLIKEDGPLRILVHDTFSYGGIEEEVLHTDSTGTRVCSLWMEAVRASAQRRSIVPIIVIELCAFNAEAFRSWSDDSVRRCPFELFLSVLSLANNESTNDLSIVVDDILSKGEFDASQKIVCRLEVVELNGTDTLSDCTIPTILV